ncbi:MAG: transposase [Candidatus Pacebacteria bacterium]|nr:transposase [Candidatus Paceibacterota bacterium]
MDKENLKKELRKKKDFLVEIVAYCLMPNHFHLLVKQAKDRGIRNFITKSCNSYSHYFSTKYKRKGPLFEGRFKAIRVETEEQLIHLSRYIHLNPYSSYLVKNFKKLAAYPFSSLPEYLNNIKDPICQKEIVLSYFSGFEDYKKFVFRQAEYQRELGKIKHLALE